MTTPPTPDAGVERTPSRMEQRLAETDRMGITALRNDLLAGGAFPPTVDHVMELLTSRTLTIYHFAEQCRTKEDHIATLTAQLAAAKADGERLDWLEDRLCYAIVRMNGHNATNLPNTGHGWKDGELRAALDAALAVQPTTTRELHG